MNNNTSDNLWHILNLTNDWIKHSDTKAIALIGIQGVIVAFILSMLNGNNAFNAKGDYDGLIIIGGVLFNSLSLFFAFLCLNPKLKLTGGVSPIYFGSIAENFDDSKQYEIHFDDKFTNDEHIKHELCGQIYVNSCIAQRKFKQVAYSVRLFTTSLAFWMILVILNL